MDEESQQGVAETPVAEPTATGSPPAEQTGPAEAAVSEPAAQPQGEEQPAAPAVKQDKPVSRRSAQYRIQQLARENAELKQQKVVSDDGQPAEQTPDVSSLVQKEVQRILNPFMSESSKTADEAELNELFTGDKASERTKYEAPIRKMWELPQYKDVAAADLYKIASFEDAVKTATERAIEEYKKAEKDAKDNSASGHSNNNNRTDKGEKTAWDLSEEEFQKTVSKVRSGG